MEKMIESSRDATLTQPVDPEAHFLYLSGKIRNCFDLIGEGSLGFACIEIDCGKLNAPGFDRLYMLVFDELIQKHNDVCTHTEALAERDILYLILADEWRKIEEAKEVFKIKDPTEFLEKTKLLEAGKTVYDELYLIKKREIGRDVSFFMELSHRELKPSVGP